MWMICSLLSTLAVLSTIQNVDTAPMMNKALKRGARGIDGSQGRNVFAPKYMMDLYNIIVDKNGNRRKGVSTTADKIKCFLPASSSNISSSLLTFDVRDIGKDETIIKAHLNLFKLRKLSGQGSGGFFQVNVVENERLLAVRILNSRGGGWKSFDLTTAVRRWHKQGQRDYSIRIQTKGHRSAIEFAGGNNIERLPFLVVYSKSSNEKSKGASNSVESITSILPKPERGPRNKRGSNGHACKRKSMIVDTNKIGWDRYVLAPRIFDAYRCEGKCRAYSSQAVKKQTNHAVLQAILAQLGTKYNGRPLKPPCCAPSEFESKTLLLNRNVKGQSVIGLEEFTDMVVKSCACL